MLILIQISKCETILKGHSKKIELLSFHPTARGVLASGANDHTVRIWNIEKQHQILQYDGLFFSKNCFETHQIEKI